MSDVHSKGDMSRPDRESVGAVRIRRQRGHSNWPFGPVGIRQERRSPFRANELDMTNTPRRRWNDPKTDA